MRTTFLRKPCFVWLLFVLWMRHGTVAQVAVPMSPATAQTVPAEDTGCCGPVTSAGRRLQRVLDAMDVDHLWLNHFHVNWETGVADKSDGYLAADTHTHCSAFAAALGERLGIYLLRPPEHGQTFLASAQGRWFAGKDARKQGWTEVATAQDAQRQANEGQLVVIVFISPDPHKSGHIAVVRPAVKSARLLAEEGPQTTQAGKHNFSSGTARYSFASHEGAWPNGVKMYAHAISFPAPSAAAN